MSNKLKVKNPFEFLDSEEQEKEQEFKENEELEEKPVMPQTTETSEDVHGGNEITESIEDSENRSDQQEEQEISESEEAIEETIMQEDSKEREPENTSSIEEESKSDEQESNSQSRNEESSETSEDSESNNSEEAQEKSESTSEESIEQNEEVENEGNSNSENDLEEDYEEDDYNDEDYEEDDNSNQEYQYNTEQVVNLTSEAVSTRYLQTEFYRFLEKFSEDKLKIKSYDDFDEWDIKKLMFRAYERKTLNAYRCTRIRDKTVLILDNSGSMAWWEENLRILSAIALSRDDVEVYIAPNGYIEAQLTKRGEIAVDHKKVMKSLQGRRIIYVGDFDGADTAIVLSWTNDVIWICPEDRYREFKSHDWVSYDESKFKGVFIRAWNLEEMFRGLKMITRYYRLWIDFHENDKFQDD